MDYITFSNFFIFLFFFNTGAFKPVYSGPSFIAGVTAPYLLFFNYSNACYSLIIARSYVILFSACCREPHRVDAAGVNSPLMITRLVKYST